MMTVVEASPRAFVRAETVLSDASEPPAGVFTRRKNTGTPAAGLPSELTAVTLSGFAERSPA